MSIRHFFHCAVMAASFIAFLIPGVHCFAQTSADAVLGEWYSPDKDGKFLFYKSYGKYYGKLIWAKNPNDRDGKPATDKKNPDPAKRNLPVLGMNIFSGFVYLPQENKWVDGKVYDSRTGDTYCCEMKLISNLVLEVHGYILYSWLGKSAYFTRNQ